MNRRWTRTIALELWLPALVVAGIWIFSVQSTNLFFPPLSEVLRAFQELWLFDRFASDIVPSVVNFLLGLAVATIVGIAVGVFLGTNERAYLVMLPLLEFLRAIPGIVLVPIGLALLGIGDGMKIAVIAYGVVWPILLNTVDGIRTVDPLVRDMVRSLRVSRTTALFRVMLPAAGPHIMAGIRISVALGVVLIIASEYVASTHGIGYVQLESERTFAIPEMWASLLLLGLLGYGSNSAFRAIEKRALRWYIGMRKTSEQGVSTK